MPINQEQEIISHLDTQNWKARCTRLRQGREVPRSSILWWQPAAAGCRGPWQGNGRSSIHEYALSQQAYSQRRGHRWECSPQDTHCGAPQCPSLGQAEPGGASSRHTRCTERNRKRIRKSWHFVVSGMGKGVGLKGDGEGPCTYQ